MLLLQNGMFQARMLIYRRTSILEANAQTVVNTVNCVGVMGKGLAKAFKERDPAMYEAYKNICERKLLQPGKLWLWQGSKSWVLNFPTKKHWRNPSRIEWIETGLKKFVTEYSQRGIKEISFPDWDAETEILIGKMFGRRWSGIYGRSTSQSISTTTQ